MISKKWLINKLNIKRIVCRKNKIKRWLNKNKTKSRRKLNHKSYLNKMEKKLR